MFVLVRSAETPKSQGTGTRYFDILRIVGRRGMRIRSMARNGRIFQQCHLNDRECDLFVYRRGNDSPIVWYHRVVERLCVLVWTLPHELKEISGNGVDTCISLAVSPMVSAARHFKSLSGSSSSLTIVCNPPRSAMFRRMYGLLDISLRIYNEPI